MSTICTNLLKMLAEPPGKRVTDSFGVRLTILEPEEEKTPEQELTQDLLTLIASFSGRLYGMRSHKQKELLQCAEAVINNP